jgi:hypothetical protein
MPHLPNRFPCTCDSHYRQAIGIFLTRSQPKQPAAKILLCSFCHLACLSGASAGSIWKCHKGLLYAVLSACSCSHQVHTDCPIDLVLANAGIIAAAPPGSSSSSTGVAALADNLWNAAHTNIMGMHCDAEK